jgi:hypothetical protein
MSSIDSSIGSSRKGRIGHKKTTPCEVVGEAIKSGFICICNERCLLSEKLCHKTRVVYS